MSASGKPCTKEAKQLAVSVAVLELIEQGGLTGVTHSKVARKAGVSRAWIYEYIGKERNALINFAAEVIAGHLARAQLKDLPKTRAELESRLREGVEFFFASLELSPVLIKLFYRFRGTDNPIGKTIRKHETMWLNTAAKTLQDILDLPADQAALLSELALTLRLGFAHRWATSSRPAEARKSALRIFEQLNSILVVQ